MSQAELFSGTSEQELASNTLIRETTRGSQEIRTLQSQVSLALVIVVAIAYLLSLWDRTDPLNLSIWLGLIVLGTAVRCYYCIRIRKTLAEADAAELMRNEVTLFYSGINMPLVIGAGYWVVAMPGDEHTLLAVTLLGCMYSIGTTINSMTQIRLLPVLLIVNLGQGILYFIGLGNRPDVAVAVLVTCILLLQQRFGQRNSAFYIESVRMRLENTAKNKLLLENQALIENALDSALEANRSKSRFLAAAAHDLRQPLHAMTLFISTLKLNAESDSQRELIDKVEQNAEVLRVQFNSLLDLSRFDAGTVPVNITVVNIHELLERLVQSLQPIASDKGIKLRMLGEPMVAETDAMLLERMVGNVIGNAIKFTTHGQVIVSLSRKDGRAVVEVIDTGCGFDQKDSARIFEDFTQLENPNRHGTEGTGLGLSIVRGAAELLNVALHVESEVGIGTRFTMTLSGDSASQMPAVENLATSGGSQKRASLASRTVLLVDDETFILEALSEYIWSRGGQVVLAGNYDEGKRLLDQQTVDFAIVDDMLDGGKSGFALARLIAAKIGIQRVIVVTGNESASRIAEMEAQKFSVFKKPVGAEDFDRILSERLQNPSGVTAD